MKNYVFAAVVILFFVSSLSAQQTRFGIKGGFNSASIEVEDGIDYESKSGIHGGFLAHIHISKNFAVQPELVYSCQGGERPTYKLKLGYLNVPVLAQFMINNGFRLQTGPQLGFLVSGKQDFGDVEVDTDDAFDSIDFSWTLGAGYLFSSGIGIDLRYNIGLVDITEDNSNAKNRVLQAGLFYQFGPKGKVKR